MSYTKVECVFPMVISSAWESMETVTIEKTPPTLLIQNYRLKTFLNQFSFPITVQISIFRIIIEFYQILNEFWNFLWRHSFSGFSRLSKTNFLFGLSVRVTLFLKTSWFSPALMVTRIEQNIVGHYWNHFVLGFCLLKLGRKDNKNDKIFWKVLLCHYQDLPFDSPPLEDWILDPKICPQFKIKSFMIWIFLRDNRRYLMIRLNSEKFQNFSF